MSLQTQAKVAVIGAGVSGLSFAHFLSRLRPDINITIYDTSSRPGGYINSQIHNVGSSNTILEKGPRTLRGASDGTVMIVDTLLGLGKGDKIKVIPSDSISNQKFLLSTTGSLVKVPNDFKSFRKFVSDPLGKGLVSGFVKEPFQEKVNLEDESVGSFLTRRFGPSLPQNVISAVFHGVYAADVNKLSAKTTLKVLFEAEKVHGSVVKSMFSKMTEPKKPAELSEVLKDYNSRFPQSYERLHLSKMLKNYPMITVDGGLDTFPKTLYEELLKNPNVSFKLNTPASTLKTLSSQLLINETPYDHIHSTINVHKLSEILPRTSTIPAITSKLTYIDIHMINVFVPRSILHHTGFGYLIPKANSNPQKILGVIFDSDVEKGAAALFEDPKHLKENTFPELRPDYSNKDYTKLTVMMGGHYWAESGPPSDLKKTTEMALKEIERHLGVTLGDDCYIDDTFIPQCLPQFHVGYEKLKDEFTETVKNEFDGKLTFGGMSFGDGAGVPDCVSNAFKNAISLV